MYLRQDEGFWGHPKTLALGRVLKNPEGGAFIQRIWAWAVRSAPDGDLTEVAAEDLEQIARYHGGPPGSCYAAMVGVGFIDELPDGKRVLHDWFDWTGADVQELAAEAKRKWWWRRHSAEPRKCGGEAAMCPFCLRSASGGPSADGRRTSTVDQARPGQTRPDPEKKRKTGRSEDTSSSGATGKAPPAPASPSLLQFETARGKKLGPTEWHYTEAVETELRGYFPALDVRSAVLAAAAWYNAKPSRKKTAGGMLSFLTGWLGRAQNRGEHRLPSGSTSESRRASAGAGLELYCDWHKQPLNEGKPSRRPKESCPSCKHLIARERVRPSNGPTPIGALADELAGWGK